MPYFLKNENLIKGPIGDAIVKLGLKSGKICSTTEISTSKNGPWKSIADVFPEAIQLGSMNTAPGDIASYEDALDLGDLDLPSSPAVPVSGSLHYANQMKKAHESEMQPRMSRAQQKKLAEKQKKTYLLFGGIGVVVLCLMIAVPLVLILVLGGNAAAKKEQDRQLERGKPPSKAALAKREQFNSGVEDLAGGFADRDADRVREGAQQIGNSTSGDPPVKSTSGDSPVKSTRRGPIVKTVTPKLV